MLPALLNFFWLLIQTFTAFSLLVPALPGLFCIVRRITTKQQLHDEELHEEKDYAIIVSAPHSSENLYALLQSLAQLDYTNYMVYVAGNYSSTAYAGLHNNKVVYLRTTRAYEPHFLHRFVIENFKRPHTHIAILNSNSRVDKYFLTGLNTFFNQGYQAVACPQLHHRKAGAGNFIQSFICRYHNFFSGRLLFLSGSSARLPSSGTAFTAHRYKQCLKSKLNNTGSASAIEVKLAKCDHQVAFADSAVVYNHSNISIHQLAAQHAQRIHSWLVGLLFSCKTVAGGIRNLSMNRFLSGLTSLRMPVPTALFIGLACLAVNVKIHSSVASLWAIVLLSLPAYAMVSAAQSSGSSRYENNEIQNEENSQGSLALYEEENYQPVIQTV